MSQQQGSQPTTSATQVRVSRICEISEVNEDVDAHDDLVFDLRASSPVHASGDIKVVHFFIGDDSDVEFSCSGMVRTVGATCDDQKLHTILLDSGADASIFPVSLLGKGHKVQNAIGKLHDAQGREIPIESVQDMEILLRDVTGKAVLLRERVAVSSMVQQPILCFGHLLQNGWSVDGVQQALTHSAGAHVPIDLQNQSMVVQGEIRMLRQEPISSVSFHVRAIQAEVMDYISEGSVGWNLDSYGRGIGRHVSDRFQDPTLVKPDVDGPLYRTTLIEDNRKWYVVELCERVSELIQLDAEFHEMQGKRNVITILTDGEKDPMVMGFKLVDDVAENFPVRPEGDMPQDDQDVDIDGGEEEPIEGAEIPEGQIAVRPDPDDEITVNGAKLTP